MAKASAIITTHSRPDTLPRAVASAQNAGTDLEIIVVDDASSDRTASVCASLGGIRYLRLEQNHGVAGARNVGMLASTGDYLTFHDDDDVRFAGSLDEQITFLDGHPDIDLVYGKVMLGDDDCRPLDVAPVPEGCPTGDVFWELLHTNFIPCLSVVFRRQCLSQVGLLEASLAGIDDWDLWLRVAERGSVAALPKPVGIWRQATTLSGQGSSQLARMHRLAAFAFSDRWSKLPRVASAPAGLRKDVERRLRSRLSEALLSSAGSAVSNRIPSWPRNAWRDFITAVSLSPSRALRLDTLRLAVSSLAHPLALR